ncbi:thiamine pyridinylase [Lacrimispora algidixylanolytica]|uniref:Thiamine pyridinylase n=1 Tax=Lacrimispora algidixylanolytica TaxID=94868 RepID=A0A419T2T5_9FIRM|nr:thiamine pyridinylase [Lacrimispora algidixylanolytica]RKD31743.1 thiamine pyridinylase [Lacrimispora algidixylanolytica]
MKKTAWYKRVISMFVLVVLLFNMPAIAAESSDRENTINVALYGYVPDIKRFKQAVIDEWRQVQPEVVLNFIEWDCYSSEPPENLDVFVFDSIFLSHFIEEDYLMPISAEQINDKEDIINFTLEDSKFNDKIYAIPQIICTNLLYTRKDDFSLSEISNVYQLYNVMGERNSDSIIPNKGEGLLIDMSDSTTKACLYLDALSDTNQEYSNYFILPDLNRLNENTVKSLKLLQTMAGFNQSNFWPEDNDSYIRAKWFEMGIGRAFIGYTEAMNSMTDCINEINFKTISLSNKRDYPLFNGDLVGINANLNECDKKDLAITLANIIASDEVLINSIRPNDSTQHPQYILPARFSVYNELKKDYPVYDQLLNIVSKPENKLFIMGPSSRTWLESAKDIILK